MIRYVCQYTDDDRPELQYKCHELKYMSGLELHSKVLLAQVKINCPCNVITIGNLRNVYEPSKFCPGPKLVGLC